MAKHQKLWAKKSREKLRKLLGNCCAIYGCENINLEFDCIEPRGDKHHKFDSDRRNTFYWKEYRAGNLQLLCVEHHSIKSNGEDPRKKKKPFWYEPDPF